MTDVFISYARSAEATARRVAEALRAEGYEVWLDDLLPAHRVYGDVIAERLDAARSVIVIWTADAAQSEWVRSEANRARAAGKLVQMRLDEVLLPMPFDTLECAKLVGWTGDLDAPGWRKVTGSVAELVRSGAERVSPPSPTAVRDGASPPRPRGRRLWLKAAAAAVALLTISALLLWGKLRMAPPAPPPSIRSVAVLPFRNLSGDASLDATAQALSEDVADLVSRTGLNQVMPLTAALASQGQSLDDLALGRRLDARFVVTASLRKSTPGLRLSYRILDTTSAQVLVAGDLVSATPDVALAERRLALRLFYACGNVMESKLLAEELPKPINDRDPINLYARLAKVDENIRRADVPEAERLIGAAEAIPETSDLKAILEMGICETYGDMITNGYASAPAQRLTWARAALDQGARAAQLKPNASSPHECRVYVFAALERWDEAMAEARHILDLIPNSANAYQDLAHVEFMRGQFGDALNDFTECAARHEQGDPRDLGLTHLFLGNYAPAIDNLREFEVQSPKDAGGALFLAAALELAGRHDEALVQADLYRKLAADDADWRLFSQSHEPAFLASADAIRGALHRLGLDAPAPARPPSVQ